MKQTTWNAVNAPFSRRALFGGAIGTAVFALTACNSGSTAPVDLSTVNIMAPFLGTDAPLPGGELQGKVEAATGKTLNINWTPNSSYEDKTNITLAGDDLPHVMVIQGKSPGFVKNAQAGAFWDLTDKLKDYPNLVTTLPQVQLNASINNKVYGIFRGRTPMRTAVILRKDWLDRLGLEVPTTTEELYEVAKAFTVGDPNGDGKGGTTGIMIPKWPGSIGSNSPYDVVEEWFGAGNRWSERNGSLVPSFETDEFLEANKYVKKMVDEKLINADFATADSTKWNDAFFNGKAGIIIDVDSRVAALITLFKQANPDDFENKVTFTGNLTGPDGKLYAHPTDGYSGFLAIPKSSVRTEADLKAVLEFLNAMNSKDVAVLLNNGIEGVNFTVTDGRAILVETETAESKKVTEDVKSFSQLGTSVKGDEFYKVQQSTEYEQKVYDERLVVMAENLKSAVYNPAAPYVSETYVAKGAQLDNIIADARIKYLAGQIDEQGLKDAIKLWGTSGGDQIKEETNKLWQENQ
ncbi:ABC transporter substrate-binding protein [Arthrobacter psychrolactophilus]|uniref:ABC transporter substrate-binding protein n=1 Tax=Arthrobacter psychrolactophilus TaxID=92442 RepID=A0A2V5IXL8_9MICC|nr:extracellular solute-binding protein [Arthrobacter psychrolactophilus]PYI39053.1 ABC transporter substrate-binding protein [Arthrobacter psychrolactophilus]